VIVLWMRLTDVAIFVTLIGGCAIDKGRKFMKALSISEARNTLPALVESVASTRAPVVLLKYGKPAAMLVPIEADDTPSDSYPLRGTPIVVSEDFDEPLSSLWEACNVAEVPAKKRVQPRKKGKRSTT